MFNTLRTHNVLKIPAIALIAGLGASACSEVGPPDVNTNPLDRFRYDYMNDSAGGQDCLSNSAYDVDAGDRGRASVTPPSARYDEVRDVLVIDPVSQGKELLLTGFTQFDHSVEAVDEESQQILDSYSCDVFRYNS